MAVLRTLLQRTQVVVADSSLCAMLHALHNLASPNFPFHTHTHIEQRDRYLAAGARLFLTNTFDAGRLHLENIGLSHAVEEVNKRAVAATKRLFADVEDITAIAGGIGLMSNHVSYAEQVNAVAEQVSALAAGGVDLLWAESISSIAQIDALTAGCALGAPQLDLVVTLAFRPNHGDPFKMTPAIAGRRLSEESQIAAIGVDTTNGDWRLEQSLAALKLAARGKVLATKADSDTLTVNTHQEPNALLQMTQMARTVTQLGSRIFALDRRATVEQLRAVSETIRSQSAQRLNDM
ncbi:MAG: homocysteine S-methyltransferase family protein [Candidatus Promineifilaceae bacterium]